MNEDALWLDAALDDELDAARSLALQERLARDPAFRAAFEARRALRAQVREGATRHAAPDALRARLEATLGQAADRAPRPAGRWRGWPALLGAAFAGACVATAGTWFVVDRRALHGASLEQAAADAEAVSAHTRATLVGATIEVASADRHTVRPWLAARLDFVPPVVDLVADGFALAGARRDVIDGATAAVLVYKHGAHTISVFVQPGIGDAPAAPTLRVVRGFNVLEMRHAAMRWRLVSDMSTPELQQLAALLRERAG